LIARLKLMLSAFTTTPSKLGPFCVGVFVFLAGSVPCRAGAHKVYTSYLWHLQQPIYWPEKVVGQNRYQFAFDSLGGSVQFPGHPLNNLADIFGKDDRRAIYQWRTRDSVASMSGADAGAQIVYSGCLIENVRSLGDNFSLGYTPTWNAGIQEAMGWTTSRGFRKLEPVGFTYHHALAPLIDRDAFEKEIALNKEIWWKAWNGNPDKSDHPKGFRFAEECFTVRNIKEVVEAGYEWCIVPNHHLSRTHPNYVRLHGSGRYDPPNKADQINPPNATGVWFSGDDTGRGSTESVPFSFQPHWAKYVDPETGQEYKIIVVPMSDLGSWKDGFGPHGTEQLDLIEPHASFDRPAIVLYSHDGDNAWGGGFSYYLESVPNFTAEVNGNPLYNPTTIQTYLDENPPPPSDVVHVEDGGWFNAENDWGHPQFINWLWPPQRDRNAPEFDFEDPATYGDIENGWAEDFRNWAVIVAAQNFVSTAEQVHKDSGGDFQVWRIQEPVQPDGTDNGANDAELAWHYFLPGLTSGYMYFGTVIDMEVKPALACNQAIEYAQQVFDDHPLVPDTTPPTVFIPQRYPWNPGSTNFGPQYAYREWVAPSDFYVWTHAYDVSVITSVVLKVREDLDGFNPIDNNDNELYAGGPSVGAWQTFAMNRREGSTFATNVFNNPEIDFFIMPTHIADEYWYQVTGFNNVLLDYYVEAYDANGNVRKTDIQHVFVGSEGGGTPVVFSPASPRDCDDLVTTYRPAARPLEGADPIFMAVTFDGWATSNDLVMIQSPGDTWTATNDIPEGSSEAEVFFHDGAGAVDDNGGANWSVPITACTTAEPPAPAFDPPAPNGCSPVTIQYFPNDGPLEDASPVHIHIGRNNWQDVLTNNTVMSPGPSNSWTFTYDTPPGTIIINCVFHDGAGTWDNNNNDDWAISVENCTGGVTQGIRFVQGTPTISEDPPVDSDQNHPGDNFDLNLIGGDAVTVDQGGFGSFGHVYVNYDATHFYMGARDCHLSGGDNNAMLLFLSLNTLSNDASVLWNMDGAPVGLDTLHNVAFDPPADLAILLGDEFGDGHFPEFLLGSGDDFGQGVFHLVEPHFVPVAAAKLSQFDGAGSTPATSADDDGDQRVNRWEVAIPWSNLQASGIGDVTNVFLSGLMVNTSTNGNDRYLSSNYLGLTATNNAPKDAAGNFAFTFVTLSGLAVGLPHVDDDGDGLPDEWEERYWGDPTSGQPSIDSDGDGFLNIEEFALGTHPLSGLFPFAVTRVDQASEEARVTWNSVGGKTYSILYSDDLTTPGGGFIEVTRITDTNVPGVGGTKVFVDTTTPAPTNGVRTYRVQWVSGGVP